MTRAELQAILEINDIPKISYSLDGIKPGECLCIVHENQKWYVLYNSRGTISYREEFKNEEDAYTKFLEVMKTDFPLDY